MPTSVFAQPATTPPVACPIVYPVDGGGAPAMTEAGLAAWSAGLVAETESGEVSEWCGGAVFLWWGVAFPPPSAAALVLAKGEGARTTLKPRRRWGLGQGRRADMGGPPPKKPTACASGDGPSRLAGPAFHHHAPSTSFRLQCFIALIQGHGGRGGAPPGPPARRLPSNRQLCETDPPRLQPPLPFVPSPPQPHRAARKPTLFELARGGTGSSGRHVRRFPSRRASAPAEVVARPPTPAPPALAGPPPRLRTWRAPSLPVALPRRRTASTDAPPVSPSAAKAAALYAGGGAAALAAASPFSFGRRRTLSSHSEGGGGGGACAGPPCLARKSGGGKAASLARRSVGASGGGGPPCLARRSAGAAAAASSPSSPWHAARAPWSSRRPGALTLALARLRGRQA